MPFPDGRHGQRRRDGWRHRRGGARCGGAGEGQWLDEPDLRLAILAVLDEQPRTGLLTMQALAERGCAGVAASPAAVHAGLLRLEQMGFVAATGNGAGHSRHELTAAGAAELAAHRLLADAILADAADAAAALRRITLFPAWQRHPRCCQRTLAAIATGQGRPAMTLSAGSGC
ncbi:PadR domain-containing protein [Rhodovastum atsumiense]|uniref:Uncharacterized protein n=1 Tax=Rhodovastum atsumiense TaxID=504468 RepID=A0A5M6J226_9PROT|nr:helix-turn-helix transcriptional regulator [Rhodovastum atsumiense]KAA5614137.1 hypothetical protein F1189_02775 [Rhodovastum atsumiense]CAH2598987.1 PadR domain-containing protein [Rhodovastum atsumiense]